MFAISGDAMKPTENPGPGATWCAGCNAYRMPGMFRVAVVRTGEVTLASTATWTRKCLVCERYGR